MQYVEYAPAAPLKHFINCFWSIESGAGETPSGSWDRTVPDGSLEFVLHLADPMLRKPLHGEAEQESRGILIGQTTRPYLIAPAGRTRMIGVRFFPQTGFLFLDGPVAPFNDLAVDIDAILPHGKRLPIEQIGNAASIRDAIGILERSCVKRLTGVSLHRSDQLFSHACDVILRCKGSASIAGLSSSLGIGNRHLEKIFLERSGISPKLFTRVIRFQHALGRLTARTSPTLASLAHETGHADQSHFIREFRRFTGLSPRAFVREQHPFTQHFAEPANRSHLYNFR